MSFYSGVDIGGTFTDVVVVDQQTGEIEVSKSPSNVVTPAKSVIDALKDTQVSLEKIEFLIHATTVGTNALIERKGTRTGFLTNKGFKDIVFIQRGNRKYHYDLQWVKPKPFVKRRDCYEVSCRIDSKGYIIEKLNEEELKLIIQDFKNRGIETIAVMFLFSYLNPTHEILVGKTLRNLYPEAHISLSHEVYPRWREYDRASTTIIDAYLKPLFTKYGNSLANEIRGAGIRSKSQLLIMKSNGGVMDWQAAIDQPTKLIMSGPTAGVLGGRFFSLLTGNKSAITMDIGGTSCDVSLIRDGACSYTFEYEVEWGIPVCSPMVDIKTIGAGGGSVAWIDKGGLLQVGPQSAGANPGPACYGKGGSEPTVTDANLILGRLNPNYFCAGKIKLDVDAANKAINRLNETLPISEIKLAESIISLANHNMADAIRLITVEKGIDPRDFTLIAFGGAGGLHVGEIAKILGIEQITIPIYPGVTSAFGILSADLRVDFSSTLVMRSDNIKEDILNSALLRVRSMAFKNLHKEGFEGEPETIQKLEMRYYGQSYHTEIPLPSKENLTRKDIMIACDVFQRRHKETYGYENIADVIEIIGLSVTLTGKRLPLVIRKKTIKSKPLIKEKRRVYFNIDSKGSFLNCPIYERDSLPSNFSINGPAIIEEAYSTTVLFPNQQLVVDNYGNLIVEIE